MKKRFLSLALTLLLLFAFCLQASAFGQFGNYNNNDRNNNYGNNENNYYINDGENWNRFEGTYEEYRNQNDRWNRFENNQEEPSTEPTTAAPPPEAISEDGMRLTFADSKIDYGYRIVIPADCENDVSFAAGTLQSMIERMTDVFLPIVSDTEPETDREICVGLTNRTKTEQTGIGTNGFLLFTENERIFIIGNGPRGTLYGVCTLLEDQFGCRWFAANETVIPKHDKLVIPTAIDLHESEYFSYTETNAESIESEFQLYNGLSGGAHNALPDAVTDTHWLTGCEGTLGTQFVSADEYFNFHSEYFALYENKRNQKQLCFSAMGVYTTVLEEVLSLLEQQKKTDENTLIISLSLQNNTVSCQCSACKAAVAKSGTNAAYYTFINRIATALQTNGYTHVKVEASALGDATLPPTEVLHENVIIRLYANDRCFSHTLSDGNCKTNQNFIKTAQAWRDAAKTLYIDLPTANRSYTLGIFPDWHVLASDLQTLYYLGADGVCAADAQEAAGCGDEFRALRIYLYTKLFADPYCNIDALQKEFLEHWYGSGYESAAELLELLSKKSGNEDGHLYIDSSMEDSLHLTEKDIATCDSLWEEIMDGCENGRHEMHTEYSLLAWRYWKACCNVGEFAQEDSSKAMRQLISDLQQAGISRLNLEKDGFAVGYLSAGRSPKDWTTSNYEVISPIVTILLIVGTALTLLPNIAVLIFAIRRRIFHFIFPVWAVIVQCFLLPWHNESYLESEKTGLLLTGALLCATAGLLTAFAYYSYHPYEEKKKYFQLFTVGFFTSGIPYAILLSMPKLLGFTREQSFALSFAVLLIHTAVTSLVMLVRFLRYFPLPSDDDDEEVEQEETQTTQEKTTEAETTAEQPQEEKTDNAEETEAQAEETAKEAASETEEETPQPALQTE